MISGPKPCFRQIRQLYSSSLQVSAVMLNKLTVLYRIKNMNTSLFPEDTVFSVAQLTSLIKETLEGNFQAVTIEGEISNYRPNASGHMYFTLKDSKSQISAVIFKSRAASLRFHPQDGMLVRCKGSLSVYEPRGNYQIIITSMEIAGEGNILMMLEERKRKLAVEGLFDEAKKKPLPSFPRTIGVITSPTGAALRDIMQIVRRRNKAVSIVILPALVQGNDAAPSIARQIETANTFHMCDVLIVGRGGGSLEDLLPFSEESVVRAVAASEIPVVSAVGHEIDWAICDFAADKRAPTPSAAAELVTPVLEDVMYYLSQKKSEYESEIKKKIESLKLMVKTFSIENMEIRFRSIEQPLLYRFDNAKEELLSNMSEKLKETRNYIQQLQLIIENSNPEALLERGYSMVRDKTTGKIIRNANNTGIGSIIEIIPAHGKIEAKITGLSQ